MAPILLLSKDTKKIAQYVDAFIKSHAISPLSIFYYRKNPTVIRIEQIREIQSLAVRQQSLAQLFVVYDFESAKKETQAAFLKTLEEQSNNAFFILIAGDEGQILPTILSRCVIKKLKVNPAMAGQKLSNIQNMFRHTLPRLLTEYVVSDREKAVQRCDELLFFFKERLKHFHESNVVVILKEILKTRNLLIKNNLNPQIAIDHLIITLKKTLPIDKGV